MSSCSLSYLGGVFDRAATISCGSDTVTDPVTGWIITPLPHNIAQLLISPHLNCNHSICCCCCPRFVVVTIPFCCFVFISTLGNAVYSLRLCAYCCVHWEEGYQSLSASAVTINTLEVAEYRLIFLGGGWPDDVRFPRRSRDSPPLVIVWAEDASIMWQTLIM
jgi:hypothetical protein